MKMHRSARNSTNPNSIFEPLEDRRLMSTGMLDPKFGTGGNVPLGFTPFDVAVDSAGRTVVAGGIGTDFAVLRFNPNGMPDTSFGTNGMVTTDFGGKRFDRAQRVAIQSDGKIVVAGIAVNSGGVGNPANGKFALARYKPNGLPDTSFGDGGKETVLGNLTTDGVGAIGFQPDGKIVFAGDYQHGGDFDFITFRLQSSGLLDGTFGDARGSGSAGYVVTGLGGDDVASALLIQPNGNIVVGGTRFILDDEFNLDQFALARYTNTGKLDKNFFGDGGKVISRMAGDSTLYSMAQQADGKIVVAGSTRGREGHNHILVLRYTANGDEDTTLSNGSIVTDASSNAVSTVATNVFVRAGRIVVVGMNQAAGQQTDAFAAQFTAQGKFDPSFGDGGAAQFNIGGGALWARAALAPDGRVVFSYLGGNNPGGVARFVQAIPQAYVALSDRPFAREGESLGFDTSSFRVGRDGAYDFPTRVYINLRGDAIYGKDYTSGLTIPTVPVDTQGNPVDLHGIVLDSPIQGYIDIPAGKSEVSVPVTVPNDNKLEPLEQATFLLFDNPSYSRKQTMQDTYVRIFDDENARIDFEAKGGTVKAGDLADTGAKFGKRGNGLSYGWDIDNSANARNRRNKRSPDSRYDSFIQMQKNGANRKWEIAVPNGLYAVTAVVGDPNATDSVYRINVEGQRMVNGTPTGDTRWFSRFLIVDVEDGRLTITNAAGAVNNKIAYIEIRSPTTLSATAGSSSADVGISLQQSGRTPPTSKALAAATRTRSASFSERRIDDTIVP